jgi:hypothetical protein
VSSKRRGTFHLFEISTKTVLISLLSTPFPTGKDVERAHVVSPVIIERKCRIAGESAQKYHASFKIVLTMYTIMRRLVICILLIGGPGPPNDKRVIDRAAMLKGAARNARNSIDRGGTTQKGRAPPHRPTARNTCGKLHWHGYMNRHIKDLAEKMEGRGSCMVRFRAPSRAALLPPQPLQCRSCTPPGAAQFCQIRSTDIQITLESPRRTQSGMKRSSI